MKKAQINYINARNKLGIMFDSPVEYSNSDFCKNRKDWVIARFTLLQEAKIYFEKVLLPDNKTIIFLIDELLEGKTVKYESQFIEKLLEIKEE